MLDVEETLSFLSCDATELLVEMLQRDGTTEYCSGNVWAGDHALPFTSFDAWSDATAELCLLRLLEQSGPFRYRMTLAGAKVALAVEPMLVRLSC